MEPWILLSTRKSWRISGHQFMTWRSSALGLNSRTVIWKTPAAAFCYTVCLTCNDSKLILILSYSTSKGWKTNRKKIWRFWSLESKSRLKSNWDIWHDLKQATHAGKPSNVVIKIILLRRVGQNSSTWKTHSRLLQMLDCSSCCQGWHSQILGLGLHG